VRPTYNPGLIERAAPYVDALKWAEHLVFVFPIWFYGVPLPKGFIERVWSAGGSAFAAAAKKAKPQCRAGISKGLSVTHGGAPWWWLESQGPGAIVLARTARDGQNQTNLQVTNDMNNVSRADCDVFVKKVTNTLKAITDENQQL
jgi:putative NADPH-quinone reductase